LKTKADSSARQTPPGFRMTPSGVFQQTAKRFIKKQTDRHPLIFPVILEI